MSLDVGSVIPFATSVGFGGIAGFLIGYAIKKVMKSKRKIYYLNTV
jgi:uncharacterized membrane protein (Fun14 family)